MMAVRQLSTLLLATALCAGIAVHPGLTSKDAAAGGIWSEVAAASLTAGGVLSAAPTQTAAPVQNPTRVRSTSRTGTVSGTGSAAGTGSGGPPPGSAGVQLFDSDGDLLPDDVERILMLDPHQKDTDGNGIDDFLHVVQFRRDSSTTPLVTDHEMRVVVSASEVPNGQGGSAQSVWVHMLFRFVGASVQDLTTFDPFLDHWGIRVPMFDLLRYSESRFETLNHPTEGLYVALSIALASPDALGRLSPCTLGASATLAGRQVTTGSFVQTLGGHLTTIVATEADHGVVQSLTSIPVDDPFWTRDRVCLFRLSQVATAPGGVLAEVNAADCIPTRRPTACPPTCQTSVGRVLYFPDGMRTVTGGGN